MTPENNHYRRRTLALVETFLDALDACQVEDVRLSLVDICGDEHRWSQHLHAPEDPLEQRLEEFVSEVEMAALRWGFQPDALAWRDRESAAENVHVFQDLARISRDELEEEA